MARLEQTQAAIEEVKGTEELFSGLNVPLRKWKGIVLHHSWKPEKPKWETNYGKVFDHFHFKTNGWNNGCGYDFVASWNPDNPSEVKIWKTYRWKNQLSGAHTINKKGSVGVKYPNKTHIGICVVGDFDHESLPEAAARAIDQKLVEPLLNHRQPLFLKLLRLNYLLRKQKSLPGES